MVQVSYLHKFYTSKAQPSKLAEQTASRSTLTISLMLHLDRLHNTPAVCFISHVDLEQMVLALPIFDYDIKGRSSVFHIKVAWTRVALWLGKPAFTKRQPLCDWESSMRHPLHTVSNLQVRLSRILRGSEVVHLHGTI